MILKYVILIFFCITSIGKNEVERYKTRTGKERVHVKGSGKKVFGGGGCKYDNQRWDGNIRTGALDWTINLGGKYRCSYSGCAKQFGFNGKEKSFCMEPYKGSNIWSNNDNDYIVTVRFIGRENAKYKQEFIDLRVGECREIGGYDACAKVISPDDKAYMHYGTLGKEGEWVYWSMEDYSNKYSKNSYFKDLITMNKFDKIPQVAVVLKHRLNAFDKAFLGALTAVKGLIGGKGLIAYMNYQSSIKNLYDRTYTPSAVYPIQSKKISDVCINNCVQAAKLIEQDKTKACQDIKDKHLESGYYDCNRLDSKRKRSCDIYQKDCIENKIFKDSTCSAMLSDCKNDSKYISCLQKLEEDAESKYSDCIKQVGISIDDYLDTCNDKLKNNILHGNFSNSLFCRNNKGKDAGYASKSLNITANSNKVSDIMSILGYGNQYNNIAAHLGAIYMPMGGGYNTGFKDFEYVKTQKLLLFSICKNDYDIGCYRRSDVFDGESIRVLENKTLYVCLDKSKSQGCIDLPDNFPSAYNLHYKYKDEILNYANGGANSLYIPGLKYKKLIPIYGKYNSSNQLEISYTYQADSYLIGLNAGNYKDFELEYNITDKYIAFKSGKFINHNIKTYIKNNNNKYICAETDGKPIGCVSRNPIGLFIKSFNDGVAKIGVENSNSIFDLIIDEQKNILGYDVSLEYTDKIGRSKIDLYGLDGYQCKNYDSKGISICGLYNNKPKFYNNKKNDDSYLIEGLEYVNNKYDRGAEYVCLDGIQEKERLYISNNVGEVLYPEVDHNGVMHEEFDIEKLDDICLNALEDNSVLNNNPQLKNLFDKGYNFKETLLFQSFDLIESPVYFDLNIAPKYNVSCVLDVDSNRVRAYINDKHQLKKRNNIHNNKCYKIHNILSEHIDNNAVWSKVKMGDVSQGKCLAGYKPINNPNALMRLCVMNSNNKLILLPGNYGCVKI